MLSEYELDFVEKAIKSPHNQQIEEVASEIHETNRIPDTYIYTLEDGKFKTPQGELVENKIDTSTQLGLTEFNALDKIQRWSSDNSGHAVWFSPPYENTYPVSKVIIQTITDIKDQKFALNRAIVLDLDADNLLRLANNLSDIAFEVPEVLRANPVFPNEDTFKSWFENLSQITQQTRLIDHQEDIKIKNDTYAKLNDIHRCIPIYGQNKLYDVIYSRAKNQGLIGESSGSCPPQLKTAFQTVFDDSIVIDRGQGNYVRNCGKCGVSINAYISKNYRCKNCNGVYEGC